MEDNERLEFLGDAVLDFLVAAWLYHHFPEMPEGNLTRLRAALVGNNQLAEFARWLGAGEVMLLGKGEHAGGGRKRTALLGSTFEAIVASLFLDQGFEQVKIFIEPLLSRAVKQILDDHKDVDPKSQLQEWAQANGMGAPIYRTVNSQGPDHAKVFVVEVVIAQNVYATGEGNSKQLAAKEAARQALILLGVSMAPEKE
jgi:ribonuclease-3